MKNGYNIDWTSEAERNLNVRRCVLSTQTTIYYTEIPFENRIVIITLFDNRQSTDNLKI